MIRRLSLDNANEVSEEDQAMNSATAVILFTTIYPLIQALRSNRRTSLCHALVWASAAWLGWGGLLARALMQPDSYPVAGSYLALALTGCAGIAVLGARRPGVVGWNFVVIGLLAILLLPLAEGWGELRLSPIRLVFLATALVVVPFNYLPTRMGLAGLVLFTGCGLELTALVGHTGYNAESMPGWIAGASRLLVAFSPWIAWGSVKRKTLPVSEFDDTWRDFRDRFGLTWALRVREQFNRAAVNAGWQGRVGWCGLSGPVEQPVQHEQLQVLRALLKRFGPGSQSEPSRRQ